MPYMVNTTNNVLYYNDHCTFKDSTIFEKKGSKFSSTALAKERQNACWYDVYMCRGMHAGMMYICVDECCTLVYVYMWMSAR